MNIPGFIDLQVNGFKGVDFTSLDLTEEKFVCVCQELFKTGTAAFLPTLVTCSEDTYKKNLPVIAKSIQAEEFKGKLLGIHLEGPFVSPEPGAVGAHNPQWIRPASIEFLKKLQDLAQGTIKFLTIAAEMPGADDLAEYATDNGIIVSLGHHMALGNDLKKLVKSGAKSITHLGNGMPNIINRHCNSLLAGLAEDELSTMIITDGHHLPDSLIKIILRTKGISRVIITSDASAISGMPAGEYEIWGEKVVLEESGYLHMPNKECMAGSSATMFECMNYLASLKLLDEEQLLEVGFYNPLRLIDIDAASVKNDISISFDKKNDVFKILS